MESLRGGIRVPFIVRRPGAVKPRTTCESPVWLPDLFASFAEVAGADASSARDGISLVRLLRDPSKRQPDRPMVWHFPYYHPETRYEERIEAIGIDDGETSKTKPHSAIRVGDWKLMHFYENDADELYNLGEDPSERTNLASRRPDETKALRERLMTYLREVDARLPTRNPAFSD